MKKERSKQGQTNNKAKQHSTPKAVTFMCIYIYTYNKKNRLQTCRSLTLYYTGTITSCTYYHPWDKQIFLTCHRTILIYPLPVSASHNYCSWEHTSHCPTPGTGSRSHFHSTGQVGIHTFTKPCSQAPPKNIWGLEELTGNEANTTHNVM